MDNLKDTCPCLDCRIRRGEPKPSIMSPIIPEHAQEAPNALTGGQQFDAPGGADEWSPEDWKVWINTGKMPDRQQQEQTLQRPQDFPGPAEGARIDPLTVQEYDRQLRDVVNAAEKEALAVNPKDLIGATKAPMSCVPASLTVNAAPVFALGARKYGRYNWRDYPIQEKAYIEALERHLLAYKDGQELDPESGCSHLAHIIAGAGIVLDALACGTLIRDTEVKPGVTAELIAAQTKKPDFKAF